MNTLGPIETFQQFAPPPDVVALPLFALVASVLVGDERLTGALALGVVVTVAGAALIGIGTAA